ncbi:MAG: class I SAM-dependent methyltransferase [Phycisphaerae bacterium]|nr:class I SAM-dependent methyltransferase [Phycisphaerae bacterium]
MPPACLVCSHHGFEPFLEILLKCPVCGFATARLDSPIDTRRIYEGAYFAGQEYLDYRGDEAFLKRNFRRRLKELLKRCPGGRLLEIGAAYGFFLDLARAHFQTVGFEVNREAVGHAREVLGLDVRTDDFLLADEGAIGGQVDVTVMWDVIEHLERPDRFLARIAELSRPGAILCLTTGDIGSVLARWRGRKWRMIHPPSHLHYFDRSTITRLLGNHGFEVIDIRAIGVARSLRQILYSLLVLGLRLPAAYRAMEKITPAAWGVTLNTFDIMQVTASRR